MIFRPPSTYHKHHELRMACAHRHPFKFNGTFHFSHTTARLMTDCLFHSQRLPKIKTVMEAQWP
jgi:hypothetical protein